MMKHLAWVLLLALTAALVPLSAQALEEDVYTIYDSHGEVLTRYCGECDTGDEYISGDNQHYRVVTSTKPIKPPWPSIWARHPCPT